MNSDDKFSVADELLKLKELLDVGIITNEEFNTAKEKLLPPPEPKERPPFYATTKSPPKRKNTRAIYVAICVFFAVMLLVGVLLVLQPWETPFAEDTEAIENASDSVVKVICYNQFGDVISSGSGFAFFDDRTFITNYHVIDGASVVKICSDDDVMFDIQFIKDYSEDYDTAILIAEKNTAIKPLSVDENYEIKRGEDIIAIGSPLGLKNTVSQGNFSGFVFEDPVQLLQFTAPISNGSSGGALLNNEGNVIGITFASYIDGQNINLAIPIFHAIDLYENAKYIKKSLRDDFINYPRLTIQELNNSYSKYIDKPVIVEGYVSREITDAFGNTLFLSSSPDFDDYSDMLRLYVPFWIAELDVPVTKGQYVIVAGEVRTETSENETTFEMMLESIYCHNS